MSEFKVSQADLSDVSRKYSGAISKTGMVRTIPLRVNTNLSISRQSGGDISIIKQNINICIGEINRLYTDLIALRNGIEAVRTESEEADRNAKRVFKPFSFGSFVRRLIDMLKELLDEDNSIVTATNNIVSKLKEWSEQAEDNQVIYVSPEVEPIIIVLNDPYPSDSGTIDIERVTTDDVQPNDGYTDVVNNNDRIPAGMKNYYYDDRYSDYNIINNFDPRYCQQQRKKNNCTTTSEAIAYSIKNQSYTDQSQMAGDAESWAKWQHSTIIEGSGSWTEMQKLQKTYELLGEGTPVILSMEYPSCHTVTVVGLRQGADINNLTYDDFLIIDPWYGCVKKLSEQNHTIGDGTGWTLKVPKSA